MKDLDKEVFLEKLKQLGIVNTIIIFIFIIALIYFIFYSIGSIGRKIFGESSEVRVYYDLNNAEEYNINSEDENFQCTLVTSYSTFYNVEEIVTTLFKKMQVNEYEQIIKIFSKDMKQYYGKTDSEYIEMLNNFYNDYVNNSFISNELYVDKILNVKDTNIYICYLKNLENIEKKIVLSVNFSDLTYKIENIDF